MTSTAIAKRAPACVRCGSAVAYPFSVCLMCGHGPLYTTIESVDTWSVVCEPIAGMRMRKDVAALLESLDPELPPGRAERALTEGQPPAWVARGLSKATADGLVAKLRELRAPAKAVPGEPPAQPGGGLPLHPAGIGLAALGAVIAIFSRVVGLAMVVAGVALGFYLALKAKSAPSVPLLNAPLAPEGPLDLQQDLRAVILAFPALPAPAAEAGRDVVNGAKRLLDRLGNEEDTVGFIAGGLSGSVGQGIGHVASQARGVVDAAKSRGESATTAALRELSQALSEVCDDLEQLAGDPEAESDLAGRLERQATRLQTVALVPAQ